MSISGLSADESATSRNPAVPARQPHLVLQPRGTKPQARDHYERSMRRGIRLAEYAGVLGQELQILNELFPEGSARLWGSTPPARETNVKAKALRERRVGDEVLFYANKHVISRARIGHLFHSPEIAKAIWGVDAEEGAATWEYVMALVDVEEFDAPVPAARLGIPNPLRSITLVPPVERDRVARLLPARKPATRQVNLPKSAVGLRSHLSRQELLTRLTDWRIGQLNGQPSRHKSLALIWAVAAMKDTKSRLHPWKLFREKVTPLLEEFGDAECPAVAEHSFWSLADSGLWEVSGSKVVLGGTPSAVLFDQENPKAGLLEAVEKLLRNDRIRAEAVAILRESHLSGVDNEALLARLGLEGFATASGVAVGGAGADGWEPSARKASSRNYLIRSKANVDEIKALYGHKCQVCGLRLEARVGFHSEAAHIRGLGEPHNGPDEIDNMLSLCPNCHKQLDLLAIYVDCELTVRRVRDRGEIAQLYVRGGHQINHEYLRYHRALCGRDS